MATSLFFSEGAIIEGLKQNRTIRMSFVIIQHEELIIPVQCVESPVDS